MLQYKTGLRDSAGSHPSGRCCQAFTPHCILHTGKYLSAESARFPEPGAIRRASNRV